MVIVKDITEKNQFMLEETDIGVLIKKDFRIIKIKNNFEDALKYVIRWLSDNCN